MLKGIWILTLSTSFLILTMTHALPCVAPSPSDYGQSTMQTPMTGYSCNRSSCVAPGSSDPCNGAPAALRHLVQKLHSEKVFPR